MIPSESHSPPAALFNLTNELAEKLYDTIIRSGCSETAAAARHGLPATSLALWKIQNPAIASQLAIARAEFHRSATANFDGELSREKATQ